MSGMCIVFTDVRGERECEVADIESQSGLTVGCACITCSFNTSTIVTKETCVSLHQIYKDLWVLNTTQNSQFFVMYAGARRSLSIDPGS